MNGSGTTRPGSRARKLCAAALVMTVMLLAPAISFAAPFAGIVMDARSGRILWESNADTRLHPASLTKMLTLYIAFDAARRGEVSMDDMVRVSAHAASQPPSRLGLKSGQRISLRHLIRAAAIKSANDAATAIGEHISGSEAAFAQRMNRTAQALGMTRSTFRNANGLTANGHLSTARDMNLLGRRLFYDFPEYYGIFSRITEDAGVAQVANTNRRFLQGYNGADGIKTGYTSAAGFNLTASAERGNKRLIATVFGGTSTAQRNQRISELLDVGFGNAPANVRTAPPRPVALDEVASAAPATTGGAGKTIRLPTARTSSPRPEPRPDTLIPAPEMLAEVASGVADVLAELAQVQAEPLPFAVANEDAGGTQAAIAVAEAVSDMVAPADAAETAPTANTQFAGVQPRARPESFASLEPPETAPADAVTEVAAAEVTRDEPLPFAVVGPDGAPMAEVAAQVAAALSAEPTAEESPAASIVELAEADMPDDLPVPISDDADSMPGTPQLAGALVVPTTEDMPSLRPKARPGQIVMTMASAEAPAAAPTRAQPTQIQRVSTDAAPADREIVTRVSTSGGRHWAVTLGNFPSRATAERALLQTALAETRALEGALRKVNQRNTGWEATFAGLTRDQADLSCRRLQARAISCFTLGP